MALINCPECKSEVSTTAASCPKCGYQLRFAPSLVDDFHMGRIYLGGVHMVLGIAIFLLNFFDLILGSFLPGEERGYIGYAHDLMFLVLGVVSYFLGRASKAQHRWAYVTLVTLDTILLFILGFRSFFY